MRHTDKRNTILSVLATLAVIVAMASASFMCSTTGTIHYFNDDTGEIQRLYP